MTKPFDISEKSRVVMPLVAILAALSLTATAAATWSGLRGEVRDTAADVQRTREDLRLVGDRVKKLEDAQSDIAVLKNDVVWIRRYLERTDAKPLPHNP